MADRALKYTVAAFFAVYLFFAFYQPLEFEDGWWHLATGRWIMEHKQVPHEDPFSFTETKSPWVLTQWLGSTIFYIPYQCGGYSGVKLFRAFLFLGIMAVFLFYSRRYAPFVVLAVLGCSLVPALWTRCFIRPDVFNYFFIQFFLIQMFAFERDRNAKRLWSLPALGCLWGNLHLGSFVFGGSLIAMGVVNSVGQWIYAIWKKEKERFSIFKGGLSLYLFISVLYFLSLTISPYGLQGLIYPAKVFLFPDFINFYKTTGFIAEQLPPNYLFTIKGSWFWFLCIGGGLAVVFTRHNKFLSALFFLFPLWMFLHGRRASVFFALAAVYVIVECARQCSWKERWANWQGSRMIERVVCVCLIVLFSFQIDQWLRKNIYDHGVYKKDTTLIFDPRNPVKAVNFLLDNHVQGNVFTNDNLGGYLIWRAYGQLKPFVDGRQLDQRLFMRYADVVRRGPGQYWDQLEKDHDIKVVLLDMSFSRYYDLAKYLLSSLRWQLVFIDGRSLVLVRKGEFRFPYEVEQLEARLRAVVLQQDKILLLQGLSMMPHVTTWQEHLWHPFPHFVNILEEGLTLFAVGFQGEGVDRILNAFAVNPVMARGVATNILLQRRERWLRK